MKGLNATSRGKPTSCSNWLMGVPVATASVLVLATPNAHCQEWAEYGWSASLGAGMAPTADQASADKLQSFDGKQAFVVELTPPSLRAEFFHRIRLHASAAAYIGRAAGKLVSDGSEYDVGGTYFSWHSAVTAGGVLHLGRMRYYAVLGPVFVLPVSGHGEASNHIHLEPTLEPRTLLAIEMGAEIPVSHRADYSSYLGGALRVERRLDKPEDMKVATDGSDTRLTLDFEPTTTVTLNVSYLTWFL